MEWPEISSSSQQRRQHGEASTETKQALYAGPAILFLSRWTAKAYRRCCAVGARHILRGSDQTPTTRYCVCPSPSFSFFFFWYDLSLGINTFLVLLQTLYLILVTIDLVLGSCISSPQKCCDCDYCIWMLQYHTSDAACRAATSE